MLNDNETDIVNYAFERAVLSSLIFEPNHLTASAKKLTSEHFYSINHQDIFEAIKKLLLEEKPIDEEFIAKELRKAGRLDERVLLEILSTNPIANIKPYIDELSLCKDRRSLLALSLEIKKASDSIDPIHTAKELILNLENSFNLDYRVPSPTNHEDIEERDAEFILKEWMPIPKDTVSLITAPGGSGKTWLVLQIAARFCMEDRSKRVFLWLSEDPKSLSKSRLNKILEKILEVSGKDLHIDISDDPTPFLLNEYNKKIGVDPIWHDLKSIFNNYDLIILDPLIAFFGADENNNGHARYFMQLFTAYASKNSKTILFIHHSTKGTTGSRGAGAFVDAVRSVYEIDYVKDKEGRVNELKSHMRVIKLTKDNYAAKKLLKVAAIERQLFPQSIKTVEEDKIILSTMPSDF